MMVLLVTEPSDQYNCTPVVALEIRLPEMSARESEQLIPPDKVLLVTVMTLLSTDTLKLYNGDDMLIIGDQELVCVPAQDSCIDTAVCQLA